MHDRWLMESIAAVVGACGVLALFAHQPATAGIPRVSRSWMYGPSAVWSLSNTTEPGLFHPLHDAMESRGIIDARVALEMTEESGSCELRSGVRFSN
ncbi:MAG: hypothetical protein QME96_11795, partial [Myxococcota bacterium]|nr:hypothetical protein [Myxococcota bacterium]